LRLAKFAPRRMHRAARPVTLVVLIPKEKGEKDQILKERCKSLTQKEEGSRVKGVERRRSKVSKHVRRSKNAQGQKNGS